MTTPKTKTKYADLVPIQIRIEPALNARLLKRCDETLDNRTNFIRRLLVKELLRK